MPVLFDAAPSQALPLTYVFILSKDDFQIQRLTQWGLCVMFLLSRHLSLNSIFQIFDTWTFVLNICTLFRDIQKCVLKFSTSDRCVSVLSIIKTV